MSVRGNLHLVRQVALARLYLRRCECGPYVRMMAGRPVLRLAPTGRIILGERVRIMSDITPVELAAGAGARLVIGARTFLNYGCSLGAMELIQIGERCLIGNYVNIIDNDFHDLEQRDRMPASRPVIIGDDVWLGTRAIVLPGVHIGQGAVVGAGSVVTRDVPAWTVVAGNPARVVRQLTPPQDGSTAGGESVPEVARQGGVEA
jgi:acetyltransferase-like isoleucine patch superfamily enzyme